MLPLKDGMLVLMALWMQTLRTVSPASLFDVAWCNAAECIVSHVVSMLLL